MRSRSFSGIFSGILFHERRACAHLWRGCAVTNSARRTSYLRAPAEKDVCPLQLSTHADRLNKRGQCADYLTL
jgi:hypothetical protein